MPLDFSVDVQIKQSKQLTHGKVTRESQTEVHIMSGAWELFLTGGGQLYESNVPRRPP